MIHSVFWSLVFGFFMAASFILAMPGPGGLGARMAPTPGSTSSHNLPMPASCIISSPSRIVVANYICALAGMTSMSRMLFAFSRDGGLPGSKAIAYVSPKHRTPVGAIWLTAALSAGATYYAPFMLALAAGCALFLYVSYAMPIAAGMLAEGKTWTEFGPFRLGVWSKPFAIISILGALHAIYAGTQPPFDPIILPLFPDLVWSAQLADQPARSSSRLPWRSAGSESRRAASRVRRSVRRSHSARPRSPPPRRAVGQSA